MRPLKEFTVGDLNYLPEDLQIPVDYDQYRVVIAALDVVQADTMLVRHGLPNPKYTTFALDDSVHEVRAMRAAGMFAAPAVWLILWTGSDLVIVQVFEGGDMQRVGRVTGAGSRAVFEADPEPTAPAGIDRAVVDWTAKRHRDALATSISEAVEDLGLLPTKLVRGGHISGELNGIIGRLVDAAGRARALEALDEILPKEGQR